MLGKSVYFARLVLGVIVACLALLFIQLLRNSALPRQGFYEVFRYLAWEENRIKTHNFKSLETNHFVIKFLDEDERFTSLVAKTAEDVYDPITGFFNFRPADKIVIVMYPDGESLARSFGWDKDERAMGVYWGGTIRILSPRAWTSDAYVESTFTRDGPIAHEFTHLLVDYMTRGNYSRWFTEGVAQYVEKKTTGFSFGDPFAGTGAGDRRKRIYDFTTLEREFDQLDQGIAYWESLQAVEYMVKLGGEPGLLKVIEALREGNSMPRAVEKGLGVSFAAFTDNFYVQVLDN